MTYYINKPIAWHKECLFNKKQSLEADLKTLNRLQAEIARIKLDIEEYTLIIEIAEKSNIIEFDRYKFLKKKVKQ